MQNLLQSTMTLAIIVLAIIGASGYPITFYFGFRKWFLLVAETSVILSTILVISMLDGGLQGNLPLALIMGAILGLFIAASFPIALWHRKMFFGDVSKTNWLLKKIRSKLNEEK